MYAPEQTHESMRALSLCPFGQGIFVTLGWAEGAQFQSFSVFQGIDFFSAGDPRDTVLCTAVIRS